jgi:hypothetical protein
MELSELHLHDLLYTWSNEQDRGSVARRRHGMALRGGYMAAAVRTERDAE